MPSLQKNNNFTFFNRLRNKIHIFYLWALVGSVTAGEWNYEIFSLEAGIRRIYLTRSVAENISYESAKVACESYGGKFPSLPLIAFKKQLLRQLTADADLHNLVDSDVEKHLCLFYFDGPSKETLNADRVASSYRQTKFNCEISIDIVENPVMNTKTTHFALKFSRRCDGDKDASAKEVRGCGYLCEIIDTTKLCSGNGIPFCKCKIGYTGADCSKTIDPCNRKIPQMQDATAWEMCGDHGKCASSPMGDGAYCICDPVWAGDFCNKCAPGFYWIEKQNHDGICKKCDCNGHSEYCDPITGNCANCRDNTEGNHCEKCKHGYHRNTIVKTGESCTICPCVTVEVYLQAAEGNASCVSADHLKKDERRQLQRRRQRYIHNRMRRRRKIQRLMQRKLSSDTLIR